ncbi:ArnT family glycosyltransferase [Robiginitalea marina]|uniref:Glycosyltransferase family 39 protein n=1 Tax=Robiginitalea marina TaxID=2954105 RepID=A0ABT1AZ82_9FLAO|nr:glycosyltransferase family 39 protein [Robiginitalea marina]MCO5724498.1 glycosyltransferase family 39 protein [Robiginitalea marina]
MNDWAANGKARVHFGAIALFTLLIRFPFFFRDYIDRDESTFILVAQSLVDGNLPYTELWDLKPPFLFFLFAVPISIFGKSLLAIRLLGAVAVAGIAIATYLIGERVGGRKVGFLAGWITAFLMSLFNSVQGVMSEHLSLLFLLPSLLLLLRHRGPLASLTAGAGFGLAVLCKTNLLVAVAVLGGYLLGALLARKPRIPLLSLGCLLLGGGLVAFGSFLPYWIGGKGMLWWEAMVEAPLAYSGSRSGFPWKYLPFYAGSLLVLWAGWKGRGRFRPGFDLVLATLLGIVAAFWAGGKLNGHYLLQFYPLFLVVFFGVLEVKWPSAIRGWVAGLPILILLLPIESYLEYGHLSRHFQRTGKLYNGEGIAVPQHIRSRYGDTTQVLFLEYHIGYWFLGQDPPSKAATHPSNICRPALFPFLHEGRSTSLGELGYLLGTLRPVLVVKRDGKPAFDKRFTRENAYLENYLNAHYRKDTLIGKAIVYKRW